MDLYSLIKNDRSGSFSKENYLLKNYPRIAQEIQLWVTANSLDDIKFPEKVFVYLNKLTKLPTCSNPDCSNPVVFLSVSRGYRKYCSNACISSDPSIKSKKEKNSLEKWGVSNPQKSQIVKQKSLDTNKIKYGSVSPMSNDEVKKKAKETLLKNHGVENPAHSKEIIDKRIESFKKSNWSESYREASIQKYGQTHPWKAKEIHKKTVDSGKKKRNEKSFQLVSAKMQNYPDYQLLSVNHDEKSIRIICPKGHEFDIPKHTFDERNNYNTEICQVCKPVWSGISGLEIQLTDYLSQYCKDIQIRRKDIIPPLELDVYIPSQKLAIEFNGLYWHSSANKTKEYHLTKWARCEELGIRIFNVWEDDWIYRKDIVKSSLLYSLGVVNQKIHARKCEIREVTSSESWSFLQDNHLQGGCKSSVRFGLYYNSELVSLMTFSKPRLPLSSIKSEEGTWELTRFCNKINIVVAGAASKLLKYFEEKMKPKSIETYSDNSSFSGGLYSRLGFEFKHLTKPGYWYLVKGRRDYRFNWRKSKLISMGADASKTEEQIMSEWGYPRIYNAGNKKWIKSF